MRRQQLTKSGEGMHYRWFENDEEALDEFGMPKSRAEQIMQEDETEEEPPARIFTRGELTALLLASVLLVYSLVLTDVPGLLFSASVLLQAPRKLAPRLRHPRAHDLAGVLKGLSISLFFGALMLLLL